MNGLELQECASNKAGELPGGQLTHPFGDDWDVFKVCDKVFMLQTAITGERIVILKAAPADAEALRESHDDVTPGYHMNKRHWITLHPDGGLSKTLVEELVTESYLRVVEKLPHDRRPVDPDQYGSR